MFNILFKFGGKTRHLFMKRDIDFGECNKVMVTTTIHVHTCRRFNCADRWQGESLRAQ